MSRYLGLMSRYLGLMSWGLPLLSRASQQRSGPAYDRVSPGERAVLHQRQSEVAIDHRPELRERGGAVDGQPGDRERVGSRARDQVPDRVAVAVSRGAGRLTHLGVGIPERVRDPRHRHGELLFEPRLARVELLAEAVGRDLVELRMPAAMRPDLDAGGRHLGDLAPAQHATPVSYTHLRAHETRHDLVCRLLLEKKKHQNK